MRMSNRPVIVFSDVDVVFNEPSSAAMRAAADLLARLSREHVPLVLCSTRTRAELEYISRELGIRHPFVCESGSAVFIPTGYLGFEVPDGREVAGYQAVEFGEPYAQVVETLRQTAQRLGVDVRLYNDMSVEDVARESGLSLLRARLAKLREYGELFRVIDTHPAARTRLFKGLQAARLLPASGRRHDHVGAPVDHRLGVDLLCGLYRGACGPVLTLGIADALSTGNVLQIVDEAVVVDTLETPVSRIVRSSSTRVSQVTGVEEWAETIVEMVQHHQERVAGLGRG